MRRTEGWPKSNRNQYKGFDKSVIEAIPGIDALETVRKTGACANLLPEKADLFFSKKVADIAYAKNVCASCPGLGECRKAAKEIQVKDMHGVLGGLSEKERKKIQNEKFIK